MRRTTALLSGHNAAHKIGQQQAAQQLQRNLHAGRSKVILHPKNFEASGEEERIAGQPNQRRIHCAVGRIQCKTAVKQQILGQASIDEHVAVDQKEALEHLQAQDEARSQRQRQGQCGAGLDHLSGHSPPHRQLTLFGSFHTIRTV